VNFMEILLKADTLLKQMGLIIEKNNKITEATGGTFNVFSILNMERLEVKTHSAFLYELLNPNGSHSQGKTYLKLFINNVLEIKKFDLSNVKVERERSVNGFGRMDLVIENQEQLIIIEMKIDAGDQDKQLKRYNEYGIKSGKNYRIYYLTLFGLEATNYSTGNEKIDYKCISFDADVLNWINSCIKAGNTPLLPVIRESLVQYSKLLEKITNQLDGGLKMEIKDLLLKENNIYIAEQIAKAIPYSRAALEYQFWKELFDRYSKQIEALGIEYVHDGFFEDEKDDIDDIIEIRKKKKGEIYFEYKVGKYKDNYLYLVIGSSGNDEAIYSMLVLGTEDEYIPFKDYDEEILHIIEKLGFINSSDYKYLYIKYNLNFYTDDLLKLQNKSDFNLAVESVGNEILDIMRQVISDEELNSLLIKNK